MTATSAHSAFNANPFPDLPAICGSDASPQEARPAGPVTRRFPRPCFGDYSRTRFESRVAFGGPDESKDAEEFRATPTRQFSLLEITSGLPDDSREADENQARRRLHDLRARVKAARTVVSTTPGLGETIAADWQKAARFYARFGITEAELRHGVPANGPGKGDEIIDPIHASSDLVTELRARLTAQLPATEPDQSAG